MSIQTTIPDAVADEVYWLLLEIVESPRASDELVAWFRATYKPKVQRVWNKDKPA